MLLAISWLWLILVTLTVIEYEPWNNPYRASFIDHITWFKIGAFLIIGSFSAGSFYFVMSYLFMWARRRLPNGEELVGYVQFARLRNPYRTRDIEDQ